MNTIDIGAATEMTWHVDGETYRIVRFSDLPSGDEDVVTFLSQLLDCTDREAAHALDVLCEDGEFVASVRDDISRLPGFSG